MKLLDKLKNTGLNLGVLIISITVFFVALFVVMGLENAQKPDTMDILAAAQDFSVGHVLTPQDLVVKTVFVDDNTSLYIRADEEGTASLVNGIVVVPVFVGQPILRTSVVAQAAGSNRLSAALATYPQGGSLFPLPLDLANVIAPSTDSFMPGDLVSITVVISSRPQRQLLQLSCLNLSLAANPTYPSPLRLLPHPFRWKVTWIRQKLCSIPRWQKTCSPKAFA